MKYIFTFFLFLIGSINYFTASAQVKPELIEPPDLQLAVYLKTNFRWECSDTSSHFRFQLSEEENFSNFVIDSIVNTKSISLFFNKLRATYYWRVASISDNKETFSDVFKFRTLKDTINLIYPPCDTTLHTKIITPVWTFVEGISYYNVLIYFNDNLVYNMMANDTVSLPYVIEQSGQYCYQVYAKIGINYVESKKCCFYIDTNTTNIIEDSNFSENKLYPNPTHEKLNINLSQFFSEPSTIKIFNTIGNIVFQKDYISCQNNNIELDVSNLNSGTYLLIIENQSRNIGNVLRFIKY